MSRKGGYKIIDLSSYTDEENNIKGIYESIINSKEKLLLICGLLSNGIKYEDTFATYEMDGSSIVIKTNNFTLKIDNNNNILIDKPNKLKLVATGRNNEPGHFDLTTELENDKLYYIEYYSDETGETSNALGKVNNVTTIVGSNLDSSMGLYQLYVTTNRISIGTIIPNDDAPLTTNFDNIKIYELPYTI